MRMRRSDSSAHLLVWRSAFRTGSNLSRIGHLYRVHGDRSIANGKTTPQACKEAENTIQTFYRWRKEYGGLKMDQAKRLKKLEKENGKLKRLVAELSLDKQTLKDMRRETSKPGATSLRRGACPRRV